MRRGKEIAQGAHASMKWLRNLIASSPLAKSRDDDDPVTSEVTIPLTQATWLFQNQKKVTVQVSSEEELLALHKAARDAGLESHYIVDSGLTEFHCVPTITALAIGPNKDSEIDKITGHLSLY